MSDTPVLLVNPNRMRPPIAPLGLEYAAAALRNAGIPFQVCDLAFAEDVDEALETALQEQYRAICVSIRNLDDAYFASRDFILENTAAIIRRIQECTDAPVILGGVGFSIAPEAVLAYCGAAYGIQGSDETRLPGLIACIEAGEAPSRIPGAVWRDDTGAIHMNPAACPESAPPAPDRTVFDLPRYFREGGQAGLETRRGCTNHCIYCVEPFAKGNRLRCRDLDSLREEIALLVDQGINVFHLCDSEFNLPPDQAMAFCAMLTESGLADHIRWYAYAAPAPFDRELADAMAMAGCAGINFGADHADPAMLRKLGRFYPPEAIRDTADACRGAGLRVMFDMLLGMPGETRESIETAIEFMRGTCADRVGLSCGLRVYPNTPLAEMILAQGPLPENPKLHGITENNDNLLRPVFFVESGIGESIHQVVAEIVDGDRRFLHANPEEVDGNYNYNDNSVLSDAIRKGARGAYWDILRRIDAGEFA